MSDIGKLLGDDMQDGDMAMLDGLGMGGEMSDAAVDQEDVMLSEMEAARSVDAAAMDGMMDQDRFETQQQVAPVLEDDFGIDPNDGLYE